MSRQLFQVGGDGPWEQRLASVVNTVREMSRQTTPEGMVQTYADHAQVSVDADRFVSLSRRDLERPYVRITRSDLWTEHPNPWKEKNKLPILEGGLFSELIYGNEPVVIDDLTALGLRDNDPAAEYFAGMRSLVAVPNYDRGESLNMVVLMREVVGGYNREALPEHVWMSNLFGLATHNLVLSSQVREAYEQVDRELKVVGDIQRSLLPRELPKIDGVELATFYQTSQRAGGDYYDFFPMDDGKWGILIADVSGHGTPAAVVMAVTHSIAHTHDGPPAPPSRLINFVNRHLTARYTNGNGTFVTAFYGILDPKRREMTFACAGHPMPRVRRAKSGIIEIACGDAGGLPLGIDADETYGESTIRFDRGDLMVLYTDGITEARDPAGGMLGVERLDAALKPCQNAQTAVDAICDTARRFTGPRKPDDDQTIVAARFS
jgi:sigma-B regulation protein RsbU (phosphoserine phosphatase)